MSHYSRILYIFFLKCYIGIWIYYFIHLSYKNKSVCEEVIEWGRVGVSVELLWKINRLLGKTPRSPFCCCCGRRRSPLSADRGGNRRGWPSPRKHNKIKSVHEIHNSTSDFHQEAEKKSERGGQLPVPAGWNVLCIYLFFKKGRLWLKGMKVMANSSQTTCRHKPTTSHQRTLPADWWEQSASAVKGSDKDRRHLN